MPLPNAVALSTSPVESAPQQDHPKPGGSTNYPPIDIAANAIEGDEDEREFLVDIGTGELLDSRAGSVDEAVEPVTRSLDQCRDHQEVLEKYGEQNRKRPHKLRWSGQAMSVLLDSGLTREQMKRFQRYCELILTRNVVLEDNQQVASHLGMGANKVPGLMESFRKAGLIRFYRRNVAWRGHHLVLINPTLVWRGYFHHRGLDHFNEGVPFSADGAVSKKHRDAIRLWLDLAINQEALH